jgi:glycosyl transferase family 25
MRIHVINLDRGADRLEAFRRLNAHLRDVVRFPAVDGMRLDLLGMTRHGDMDPALLEIYTRGAVGNVMSHLALWEQAIADDAVLTICEDDSIFNRNFVATAQALIARLPAGWDWISWGWNFNSFMQMDFLPGVTPCTLVPQQKRMRMGVEAFQAQVIAPAAFPLLQAFGLPCYTISPKGAREFRARCWPIRQMRLTMPMGYFLDNVGIDVMTSMAYPVTQSFVCFPPLVISKNEADKSTVQGTPKAFGT